MTSDAGSGLAASALDALEQLVEEHVTAERVRRYLRALSDVPAPSTAASALRGPVLRRLLEEDELTAHPNLHLYADFERTGNMVLLTGRAEPAKPVWYFAHLDTLSYLVQPRVGDRHPLVPFGYHMIADGSRRAVAYRFDVKSRAYWLAAHGRVGNADGAAAFWSNDDTELEPGDRVVLSAAFQEDSDAGNITAHVDNAGSVAALAVAAGVLARAEVEALIAFPDEEEGPESSGNQSMGRGSVRLANLLPPPEFAIAADVQQAGGQEDAARGEELQNHTRVGSGAVLAEFASLARGAVTPPHLYTLARAHARALQPRGVRIQPSNNAYTSRSDDVGLLLRTPNILLLGFPGFDRHFDDAEPRANLHDLVDLAKACAYFSALRTPIADVRRVLASG